MPTAEPATPDPRLAKALDLLRRRYGYRSFRPGQWEAIAATLDGRDSVVLMPTGGGKSLCYQIPALLAPGCALVVSPLIALMNDQVQALKANGIAAGAVHSNQDESLNRSNLNLASQGLLKLLYISPERLVLDFESIVRHIPLSMAAVDEAHCISQWGHDFRPVYKELSLVKAKLPSLPVMALTATADRLTRSDIAASLSLRDPFKWTGSFDRPNISLTVLPDPGKRQRVRIIADLASRNPRDSGIVYCLSRRKTEDMAAALRQAGIPTACYHAGMNPADRESAQADFLSGNVRVVCATVAFGMGIDKSNIRWVVHNNIPGNIESYYQEIGRAGRDGLPAQALLFYNYGDILTRRSFVEESGQRDVNSEKLDFMQRYAEASVCRRRILLSYFSEETTGDCGNCDNCRHPRPRTDGTVAAQKALSAIIRTDSREAINNIIDILRGSNRHDLAAKGYDRLKTFGAGRDLSSRQWHSYILQMIQLGLIEVAYDDNFHLRPTPLGMKTVRGQHRVELVAWMPQNQLRNRSAKTGIKEPKTPEQTLLEKLQAMRDDLARKENLPPHTVLGDATLMEITALKPHTLEQLLEVTGISEVKAVKYGRTILSTVNRALTGKASLPAGMSQRETLLLFDKGMPPHEIAALKGIQEQTVYSHLLQWLEADRLRESDFGRLVSPMERDLVETAAADHEGAELYREMADLHGVPQHKVRMALAMRGRKRKK